MEDEKDGNILEELAALFRQTAGGHKDEIEDQQLLADLSADDSITAPQAFSMLLVDLAMIDQDFDPRERDYIAHVFKDKFKLSDNEIAELVNQAELLIKNSRSTQGFAQHIKENISLEERQQLLQNIKSLVAADQVEDDFEVYLQNKFAKLLGLESS